jgi:hypothetical protein
LASSQFRLVGHGRSPDAAKEILAAASSFGNITSPDLTDEQMAGLAMVAETGKDPSLTALLATLQQRSQPNA